MFNDEWDIYFWVSANETGRCLLFTASLPLREVLVS